jgi:hypothetical protein
MKNGKNGHYRSDNRFCMSKRIAEGQTLRPPESAFRSATPRGRFLSVVAQSAPCTRKLRSLWPIVKVVVVLVLACFITRNLCRDLTT